MEYRIQIDKPDPDVDAIIEALQAIDPAALADLDSTTHTLRLSATMLDRELLDALADGGCPVKLDRIERLPSVCCGGCGG